MFRTKTTCLKLAWAAILTTAFGALTPIRAAAETTPVRVKETIEVQADGDMKVHLDVKTPAGQYTQTKANNPNLAAYLRQAWQQQPAWLEVRDFQGSYDDGASTVRFQWAARGAVRPAHDDRWEVPLFGGDDADLVSTEGNTAILTEVEDTPFGQASVMLRVTAPAGAKDIHFEHGPARLTFSAPPVADAMPLGSADFAVDVKPQVMSCLAKAVGNPRFSDLWVARTTFTNTDARPAKDYKVRFHVKGYAETWTEWKTAPVVAPGQTIVDPYFPLFDMSKLAALEGPQEADLEVEYQYTRGDNETVHKTETRRLKLLDRNQALSGGLSEDEIINWHDRMNYMPYVLSAFVTHDDPIIRQAAGWVSGRAGGAASAFSDDEAMKYMDALYNFMEVNKIAYQSPPFATSEGAFFQHIKYGRDVLQNKAGTCIDLAIFWASMCDAVGLEPEMVSTQLPEGGHCFPVIRLPVSGRLIPVETTMIGHGDFQAALKKGDETFQKVQASCPYYLVRVRMLQDKGCSCIELPKLPGTALKDWDITNPEIFVKKDKPKHEINRDGGREDIHDAATEGKLVGGVWETEVAANGQKIHQVVQFTEDGGMVSTMRDEEGHEITMEFQYTYADGKLSLERGGQVVDGGKIVWLNADRIEYQTRAGRIIYTRTAN